MVFYRFWWCYSILFKYRVLDSWVVRVHNFPPVTQSGRTTSPSFIRVDEDVNNPEERRPRRSMANRVFCYRLYFGKEINRKRWVNEDVNLPEERRPRRSTYN